jgi:hypothetical protein
MDTNMKKLLAGAGAIAVLAVGGTTLAGAAAESGSTGSTGCDREGLRHRRPGRDG